MIFFDKKNSKGETVAKSQNYRVDSTAKEKAISNSGGDLILVISDEDMIRSSRLFGKLSGLAYQIFDSIYSYFQDAYLAQSHTLKKIQGQLYQKIDSIVQHPEYERAEGYDQKKQIIVNSITSNPESTADAIFYLQKRIFELSAHMASFELLHLGERIYIDKKKHNIRRLILNVWHGFDDVFREKGIHYRFNFEDGIAEENKCILDYKTINAALYNIFDNATKYSMPGSNVRFSYTVDNDNFCLIISTLSLRIDEDEISKICNLGFRSRQCKGFEGSGVGLYIVKKALDLNGLSFQIIPRYDTEQIHEGIHYYFNDFTISGIL